MILELQPFAKRKTYTISKLYANGKYICDILEDLARKPGVKVYGETAIPEGTYKVVLTPSPKFKRVLPLLLDVPGFTGIRIHEGNTAKDTHGCLIPGINDEKGKVHKSLICLSKIIVLLQSSPDAENFISIKR